MTKRQGSQAAIYFENLNAIRFIAAFMVIIHHIEQLKGFFSIPYSVNHTVMTTIGSLGVILFFVLSGFLITYLLFKEQEVTGTVCVKQFYIRRILRIWPLYFFIILSSFFIFPFIELLTIQGYEKQVVWHSLFSNFALYVLFLPNMVLSFIPYAAQAWSIGAEEQFYLIWPVLIKRTKNKWLLMGAVILVYLTIRGVLFSLPSNTTSDLFKHFWAATPIDCMAIGGIFALIARENGSYVNRMRDVLFSKMVQWTVLLLTILITSRGVVFPFFHNECYSVLFGILIFNFAMNKKRIFSMEFAWLNYLGKISYGLYMYHYVLIVVVLRVLKDYDFMHNALLFPLALLLTIVVSACSYEFYEKRFIQRKIRYSVIISGDNVRQS